jgi:hypothetical protein
MLTMRPRTRRIRGSESLRNGDLPEDVDLELAPWDFGAHGRASRCPRCSPARRGHDPRAVPPQTVPRRNHRAVRHIDLNRDHRVTALRAQGVAIAALSHPGKDVKPSLTPRRRRPRREESPAPWRPTLGALPARDCRVGEERHTAARMGAQVFARLGEDAGAQGDGQRVECERRLVAFDPRTMAAGRGKGI